MGLLAQLPSAACWLLAGSIIRSFANGVTEASAAPEASLSYDGQYVISGKLPYTPLVAFPVACDSGVTAWTRVLLIDLSLGCCLGSNVLLTGTHHLSIVVACTTPHPTVCGHALALSGWTAAAAVKSFWPQAGTASRDSNKGAVPFTSPLLVAR
jgi:hypothetical protein